eukprot:COSAG02_NODE_124_length_35047_cov_31.554179_2_plen_37_part_00
MHRMVGGARWLAGVAVHAYLVERLTALAVAVGLGKG